MMQERRNSQSYTLACAAAGFALFLLYALLLPYLSWILQRPQFDIFAIRELAPYLQGLLRHPLRAHQAYFTSPASHHGTLEALLWLAGGFAVSIALSLIANTANPYRSAIMLHGDAKFASDEDLAQMEELKQIGPSGRFLHFGHVGKRRIALIETISTLLLAPPGTGKTAGFVVPALIATGESSFIVNDPKPEVWDLTSGHRSVLGPAYRLEWPAIDDPEKDVYYPRFNFLDPRVIPPEGPNRDTFVDALAQTLVPPEKAGQTYFIDKGRAALTGFVHAIVSKVNDREDSDRYDGIPHRYHGMDASLPMMVEWIAGMIARGLSGEGGTDPMGQILQGILDEAQQFNYANRARMELAQLVPMAKDERSGVLGTLDQKVIPFKNQAVAERASASTFLPTDLRGRLTDRAVDRMGLSEYPSTPEHWDAVRRLQRPGDWKPVSVYCTVNQAQAKAFATITALFFQTCSQTLLAYGPGETTGDGILLGPYPVCFLMDEFAKLPRIDAVLEGPDLGRSKATYYMLIAQDYGQIGKIYSKEDQQLINGTTGVKLVLAQNNPESVKVIAEMVGKTTVRRTTVSRQAGFRAQIWGGNKSEHTEGVNLLSTGNIVHMPRGTHLILAQNFLHRPIRSRTPLFFLDPDILKCVRNPRTGQGPPPAPPMPDRQRQQLIDKRQAAIDAATGAWATERMRAWRNPELLRYPPDTGP